MTVTLEYPVFEGDTEAERSHQYAFSGTGLADKMASYEAEPDSLAEEALEFGESEVVGRRSALGGRLFGGGGDSRAGSDFHPAG